MQTDRRWLLRAGGNGSGCPRIEIDPARPRHILTEPGVGYRLKVNAWKKASYRRAERIFRVAANFSWTSHCIAGIDGLANPYILGCEHVWLPDDGGPQVCLGGFSVDGILAAPQVWRLNSTCGCGAVCAARCCRRRTAMEVCHATLAAFNPLARPLPQPRVYSRCPGQLERIFECFYQVDGSATRHYGGVGLGLALVRQIVQAHSGQITVTSRMGVGTTFTVRLPAA
jgi:hypothetical protein